jgi:hypothetical protein
MQLAFRSQALANLCNCESALTRKWGQQIASAVGTALYLLWDLPNLAIVRSCPGFIEEPLNLSEEGVFPVIVQKQCQILVKPDHVPIPYLKSGALACDKVTALIILEVNGYGA